jgi:outer membrane protein assembly factor BamE (lipoprotein component of BamABCDE complex)
MNTRLVRLSLALGAAIAVSGCTGVIAHKGAVVDPQLAASIQPGIDNKASVEKLLGRPSFTGQFNQNEWYYLSRDTKQIAFRNPRVRQQTVLLVKFDQGGNVTTVDRSGKEYVAGLDPSSRKTPTLGRQRGFFEDLFGNIGTVGAPIPGSGQ